MLKKLLMSMTLLVFLAACNTAKNKNEDGGDGGISSEDMSYDAKGSDSGKISGLETVFFGYDQSTLSPTAKAALKKNTEWLKSHSNLTLQIEGHCDSSGSVEYNLALGERRAKSVRAYMQSLGADSKKLSIISYGKERPLVQGDDEAANSKNRRANFVPIQ